MPEQPRFNPHEAFTITSIASALEDGRATAGPSFTARSLARVVSLDRDAVAAVLDRLGVHQRGRGAQPYHRDTAALAEAIERHLPEAEMLAVLYENEEEQVTRLVEELEALRPGLEPHPPAETDTPPPIGDVSLGGILFTG